MVEGFEYDNPADELYFRSQKSNTPPPLKFVGLWIRSCATIIDSVIFLGIWTVFYFFIDLLSTYIELPNEEIYNLIFTNERLGRMILFLYPTFYIASGKQATPGKSFLNICVVNQDLTPIGNIKAYFREVILKLLPLYLFFFFQMKLGSFEEYQMICQLSYIPMLLILTIALLKLHLSSTKSGLHDSLCSTYVVYGKIINKVFIG